QVWLQIVCPSATIRRTTAAYAATCRPIRQKVALTWYCASRSRTCAVYGNGPSSKVSATATVPVVRRDPSGPAPRKVGGTGAGIGAGGSGAVTGTRDSATGGACACAGRRG